MRRAVAGLALLTLVLVALQVVLQGLPGLWLIVRHPTVWDPPSAFGVLPGLVGSVAVAALAMALCVPFAPDLAVCIALGGMFGRWVRRSAQVMVAMPSVALGLIGLATAVPALRALGMPSGFGLLAGTLVLALIGLPQLALLLADALATAPLTLLEGALALGASPLQAYRDVLLPAVRRRHLAARVLTLSRLLAETMAVQMVLGGAPIFPPRLDAPAATLTTLIVGDMGGALPGSPWWHALWALALVLWLIALCSALLVRRISDAR